MVSHVVVVVVVVMMDDEWCMVLFCCYITKCLTVVVWDVAFLLGRYPCTYHNARFHIHSRTYFSGIRMDPSMGRMDGWTGWGYIRWSVKGRMPLTLEE